MIKNALIIFKKELKRFFFDRRMLLAIFLPGILMFVIYTFMGNIMQNNLISTSVSDTTYQIAYSDNYANDKTNLPKLLSYLDPYLIAENKNNKANYQTYEPSKFEEYKAKLKNQEIHLLISFSDNFDDQVKDANSSGNNITILYNSETNASTNLYSVVTSFIDTAYNNYTKNISGTTYIVPDIGEKNAVMMRVMSFVLPMVTVSVLYATITSFCPESISGEKERGTLASILLTPIKTSEFILGKIMALSVVAIASGLVSFLGLISSLPKMMGLASLPIGGLEIFLLLLLIVASLFFFVSFGVLISSLTNTVKEAGSYLGPFSALFMGLSIVPTLLGSSNIVFSFIPVLNLSTCISALFYQSGNLPLLFSITIITNLLFTALFVFAVTKLFKQEKIILGQ